MQILKLQFSNQISKVVSWIKYKNRRRCLYKYTLFKEILVNVCISCKHIKFAVLKEQHDPLDDRTMKLGSTYSAKVV
jgi:hypothetical protein